MSLIAMNSDSNISSDLSRLINHFKVPLDVKKDAKIGLSSLSFKKEKQFRIVSGTNNKFFVRLGNEGNTQIGQQIPIILTAGIYTGDELASHITTKLNELHPLSNWLWACFFYKKTQTFEIYTSQHTPLTLNTTLSTYIEPSSGTNDFVANGSVEAEWTTADYTTSTAFTNRVTDQMITTNQLLADGTNTAGIDDQESGGLCTVQIPPQLDNGALPIGNGTVILGLLPYWMKEGVAAQNPVLGNTNIPVTVRVRDNAGFTGIEVSINITKPDRTVSPPGVGWQGLVQNIMTDINPTTGLSAISVGGSNLVNWAAYTYKVDHVYVSIEVERMSRFSVWLWHDTAGDQTPVEKQKIAVCPENNFDYMLKTCDYPLCAVIQKSSGNTDTRSSVYVTGNFSSIEKTNSTTVTASQISFSLDPSEISDGNQNAMELTFFSKFGQTYPTDGLTPFDRTPNTANMDVTLGMERFTEGDQEIDHGVQSTKLAESDLITPDIHVELQDFNIKSIRGKRSDIGKIIAVIPSEELSSNLDTGTIHWSTSTPIMLSLNLEKDTSISGMTCNLRDIDGKLLTNLLDKSSASFLVQ